MSSINRGERGLVRALVWGGNGCALLALLVMGACRLDDLSHSPPTPPPAQVEVGLAASTLNPGEGDTVGIALTVRTGLHPPVGAFQTYVRFDPTRLEYLGQIPGRSFAIVNEAGAGDGLLRLAALDPRGLPERPAHFAFRVRQGGGVTAIRVEPEAMAERSGARLRSFIVEAEVAEDAEIPDSGFSHLDLEAWRTLLAGDFGTTRPVRVPGEYRLNLRFGDASLDGNIDIVGDAFYLANVSVGNSELINGTDMPSRDAVIAGNVDPANLPGLGEPGDAAPPGRNPDGSFSIDIFDAALVANEAVGNNPAVVGDVIPGRGPVPTERVIVSGNVLMGTTRTFTKDTVYELHGMVNVVGSATLIIQPGTRIEGDVATRGALVIRRGGMIDARGTRLEPIVFSCNAAVKTRGCWGGLALSGFSLLNNGETFQGDSVNGCPQKIGPVHPGYYGGCLVQHSSGILRYVRIEYAGMPNPGTGAVPGLALLGVGSGTTVDSIQVYQSLGAGVYLGGGTVNLRNIVSTNNAGDGLMWEDGWVGKAQFVIIQQDTDNDHGLHGSNFMVNPNAGPRSAPQIYNLTVSGPTSVMGASATGLLLEWGTDLILRNAIIYGAGGPNLDIQGAETCARAVSNPLGIAVENSIFFAGNPDFSADSDCIDEAAYALNPLRQNRVVTPGLKAIGSHATGDFRPAVGSAATVGYATPPSDGFFDTSALYVGAVAPANVMGSNVPWYSGWTLGW